jgi:hypothetical protein
MMDFDKDREVFVSEKQMQLWDLGRNLIPSEISLADIKDDDFKECCLQLYQCAYDSYSDALNNMELYSEYDSNFFISMMCCLVECSELLDNGSLLINERKNFKSYKTVVGDTERFRIFERQGIFIEKDDGVSLVSSRKYPGSLKALYRMYHEEPKCVKYDYQRAIYLSRCDFRIFTKGFSPDFNDLLRPLPDKHRKCLLELHHHAISRRAKPDKRSYLDIQCYTYMGHHVMDVHPDKIVMMLTHKGDLHDFPCDNNDRYNNFINEVKNSEQADKLIPFCIENVRYCSWCRKSLKDSPRCHIWLDIFGSRQMLCKAGVIEIKNIDLQNVWIYKQLLDIRIKVIDGESAKIKS